MPNEPMMDVGGYQFGIETAPYERLRRTWAWRWAQQDVLSERPFQQYIGPGHTELDINGYITPHFKGGLGQVDAMRAEADRGEPLVVVDSLGNDWGDFVITEIVETRRDVGPAGLPLRIEFNLTLVSTEIREEQPAPAAPAEEAAPGSAPPGSAAAETASEEDPAPEPNQPPGRVETVGLENRADGILVDWSAVPGATSYELQWEPSGRTFLQPNTVTLSGTSYLIPNAQLEEGEDYYFRIRGKNAAGEGAFSFLTSIRRVVL